VLDTSPEYKEAIIADVRRIVPGAIMDLIDPDIVYGIVTSSGESIYSKSVQLHDKLTIMSDPTYITGEKNRWLLNGTQIAYPADPSDVAGQQGFLGSKLSDANAGKDAFVQLNISNIEILQAAAVFFSGRSIDGVATDFTFDIYSGDNIIYSRHVTGNLEKAVFFEGFTVHYPTALRVTIDRWSIPSRYVRMIEIIPGIYEEWEGDTIYMVDVLHQADFSCLSLPYDTATLEVYNEKRRFDPANKSGVFQSIEERQGIPLWKGVETTSGIERIPEGVFHQQNGGWQTSGDGLTMRWRLVSVIGLLSDRKFKPPTVLPASFEGWIAAIVSQLGRSFEGHYRIDGDLSGYELSCTPDEVGNITCGNLLRFICQAVGAYPKTDPETGYLWVAIVPTSRAGIETLDNLDKPPTLSANADLAAVIFKLGDAQYIVGGTNTASEKTVTVNNPFIITQEQANAAARNILINYGGNKIQAVGRGDMSRETGDVDLVEIAPNHFVSARRHRQQFRLVDGVMKNVQTQLIQATGDQLYTHHILVTESGPIQIDDGVTEIKAVLISGGDGGAAGTDGTWEKDGIPGAGGLGAEVNVLLLNINSGQTFNIVIGVGGAPGSPGGDTVMGPYSSAAGTRYGGYADIITNSAFAIPGVDGSGIAALPNTGNGGGGGQAGQRGIYGYDGEGNHYIRRYPSSGRPGASGGSGCVIIYYEVP